MKVHGKSPPPTGSGYESDDSTTTNGTTNSTSLVTSTNTNNNTNTNPGQTNIVPGVPTTAPGALNNNPPPGTVVGPVPPGQGQPGNLSEWYICHNAGMPTPPSNEHSPVGSLTHVLPPSTAAY